MNKLLRIYGFAAVTTLLIWAAVGAFQGWAALYTVIILTILEITFSFDNAVVNSKLLGFMSPWWQKIFMTAGILVAVFVVRFALPIFIVMLTTGSGFDSVINLALHDPHTYAAELTKAGPMIDAFGGTFLGMIALSFLLDAEKDTHWIGFVERRLAAWGRLDNVPVFIMLVGGITVAAVIPESTSVRLAVAVATLAGMGLHVGLDILGAAMEPEDDGEPGDVVKKVVLVGGAAAVMFMRLEMLDASFSFDGVIGAFAITSGVVLIMAGLGAGAMWVRSMTVHLVQGDTLAKLPYLEHAAHYAIGILSVFMALKLFHIDPPEAVTGSVGLVLIAAGVFSSIMANRRHAVAVSHQTAVAPLARV